MDIKNLVEKNRSYRGYDNSYKVTRCQLEQLVEYARLCPSTVNKQPLKFYLSCSVETNAIIQQNTVWAGKLKDRMTLPHPGKEPTAFIVVCLDKNISPALGGFAKDVGIVSQTMLLGAVEMGLGGCMIGSFNRENLVSLLGLGDDLSPELVIAIGKPDDKVVLTDPGEDGDTSYDRDENDVHYVPKRTLKELVVNK